MSNYPKNRKPRSKAPDELRDAIKTYYLNHGCTEKELAKVFGLSLPTSNKITTEALMERKKKN